MKTNIALSIEDETKRNKNSKSEVRCREAKYYTTYQCRSKTVNLYYPPCFSLLHQCITVMITPVCKTNDGIKKNSTSKVDNRVANSSIIY